MRLSGAMKFKYYKIPGLRKGGLPTPIIEVGLSVLSYGTVSFPCLVDSGADSCIFSAELVGEQILNIDVRSGAPFDANGLSNTILRGYLHPVELKIGGWSYKIKFGFVYGFEMPFGILGREGFFNLFKRVCFDQDSEEVTIQFRKK